MTIAKSLNQFYKENNLSEKGGEDDDYFYLKFKFFSLKLPNSQFRKDVIHVHDIQHVLYDCDVTWKGEAFIAGWEVAPGMWKHFPIGIMSLWAMGFSLLLHPKQALKGFLEGLKTIGVIDLKMDKETLLKLSVSTLKQMIQKEKIKNSSKLKYLSFTFWCFVSLATFLVPILLPFIVLFQLFS